MFLQIIVPQILKHLKSNSDKKLKSLIKSYKEWKNLFKKSSLELHYLLIYTLDLCKII